MEPTLSGYEEIPHQADWSLKVWAPERTGLFQNAAEGMFALMGIERQKQSPVRQELEIKADDDESLLVAFLSELLYALENRGMAFLPVDLQLLPGHLEATVEGVPVISQNKEIKAVTYYRLAITPTERGVCATITFDV